MKTEYYYITIFKDSKGVYRWGLCSSNNPEEVWIKNRFGNLLIPISKEQFHYIWEVLYIYESED